MTVLASISRLAWVVGGRIYLDQESWLPGCQGTNLEIVT